MVLFPVFSILDKDSLANGVARFALVAGSLTTLVGPILAIALPQALPYLFGAAFADAKVTATILVSAYLIRGWNQMLSSILRGAGQPLMTSMGEIGGLLIMAALLIYLVPRFGAEGAAASVLAGSLSTFVWLAVRTLRTSNLSTARLWSFWSHDVAALRQLVHSPNAARP
jgi:O-antigen/teichoic acid export membrane protein